MTGSDGPVPDPRLESWKEIAAYLRRGVRTVRRWEREEGLPVHRHLHRSRATIYARPAEIDAWWGERRPPVERPGPAREADRPARRLMVAVLPFANLGTAAESEHVGDGLTEEVIACLGQVSPDALGVIARTTVRHYRDTGKTVRQIGEELGVDFVLEGSVRREGERVRVTAELARVSDQVQTWAATYERPVRSILALQQEIASQIGREVRVTLTPQQRDRLETVRDVAPGAYFAYLRGRHQLNAFTSDAVRQAVACFRTAATADPSFASAHAALAEAYAHLAVWTDAPSSETAHLALDAAATALRLDPGLAEAHAALALINANYAWDWPGAEREFLRALQLNPGLAPAAQWYAEFLAELGRTEEALAVIDLAARHDPLSPSIPSSRAFVLWLGRRFDDAVAQAEQVLRTAPDYPMALIRLGVAHAANGAYDRAVHALEAARAATPGLIACTSLLGYACARAGRRDEAVGHLEALRREAGGRYVPPFLFANVHIGLGEHEIALDLIEREYAERGWYLLLIGQSPIYDPLRGHPRFRALLHRLGMA
jgi:TolB-like protein/tetratricopeptide (TPR) repeat protein